MPFKSFDAKGVFSPEDLKTLQSAYDHCLALVGHHFTTKEEQMLLAKNIFRLFESGERNPDVIARRCILLSDYNTPN